MINFKKLYVVWLVCRIMNNAPSAEKVGRGLGVIIELNRINHNFWETFQKDEGGATIFDANRA